MWGLYPLCPSFHLVDGDCWPARQKLSLGAWTVWYHTSASGVADKSPKNSGASLPSQVPWDAVGDSQCSIPLAVKENCCIFSPHTPLPKEGSSLGSGMKTQCASAGHSSWSFMTSNLQISLLWVEPAYQAMLKVVQQTLGIFATFGGPLSSKCLWPVLSLTGTSGKGRRHPPRSAPWGFRLVTSLTWLPCSSLWESCN